MRLPARDVLPAWGGTWHLLGGTHSAVGRATSMLRFQSCPACGNEQSSVIAQTDSSVRNRFLAFSERKYGGVMNSWIDDIQLCVLRCANCGHHWYREQPSEEQLFSMYGAAVPFHSEGGAVQNLSSSIISQMNGLFRACKARSASQPTMLDYGSGQGRWAKAAVEAGFRVCAFDPVEERLRDDNGTFEAVSNLDEITGRSFHAVNLEQVLEHVTSPLDVLRGVRAFCLPTTILRVSVPNILRAPERGSLWTEWPFNGSRIHTMAPFEHLHGFTATSLDLVLTRAGFRPLRGVLLWRHFGFYAARKAIAGVMPALSQTLAIARPAGPRG